MKRLVSLLCAGALLLALSAACAAPTVPGALYDDVPDSHWGIGEITFAHENGLMTGVGERQFGLGQDLTRGSFATMLCRMFDWDLLAPEAASYIDCAPQQWCYAAVETALAHGAMLPGINARPDDPITRMEMAEMLVRALGYGAMAETVEHLGTPFVDVPRSGFATIAYDIGMVQGVEQGGGRYMLPTAAATREEACAMFMRVFERYSAKLEWLHGFYALSSYHQIALTAEMDAVSLGWARMSIGEDGAPYLLQERREGNEWVIPADSGTALRYFDQHAVPYNLNIYASVWDKVTVGEEQSSALAEILKDDESRKAAVAAIAAQAAGYAGITIDFEGASGDITRDRLTAFMRSLRAALPQEKTLYICVMPDNYFSGYDFRALGEVCDKVIMMAHDYVPLRLPEAYLGTPRTEYPEAPAGQVYRALRAMTHPETGVADRSRIALAISIASTAIPVDEHGNLTSTQIFTPNVEIMTKRLKENPGATLWSEAHLSPNLMYQNEEGDWFRAWYEDARSVEAKIRLARMFGVNGVSFWRIGQIPVDEDAAIYYNVWESTAALR